MRLSASLTLLALAIPALASVDSHIDERATSHLNTRSAGHKTFRAKRSANRPSPSSEAIARSLNDEVDQSEIGTYEERDDFQFDERAFFDESQDHLEKRAFACPAGYQYRVIREGFEKAAWNSTLWTLEDGNQKRFSWDKKKKALRIATTPDNDNTVFASKLKWLPGSTFTVIAKPANAPGVCTPYIFFAGTGSDEIDLEFVGVDGKSIQTVVWQKGVRIASSWDQALGVDSQANYNSYRINWGPQKLELYVNNQLARTLTRPGADWALDPLPMKWGPWAVDPGSFGDWAGRLDWSKTPVVYSYTRAVKVSGCSKY